MKKLLVLTLGFMMLFLTTSVLACENCDCGCEKGEKCKCKKEVVKDCDCPCHQSEKCNKENCNCSCHKKCKCDCGCKDGKKCVCDNCKCSKDCNCGCKKSKNFFKKIFKRNKIKCNCEE